MPRCRNFNQGPEGTKEKQDLESLGFEPKIAAFCCQYCAYNAADLAGSMRLQYPPFVRIIRLLCTGKIDSLYLLKAFEDGADAVFVAG